MPHESPVGSQGEIREPVGACRGSRLGWSGSLCDARREQDAEPQRSRGEDARCTPEQEARVLLRGALLALELATTVSADWAPEVQDANGNERRKKQGSDKPISEAIEEMTHEMRDLYDALSDFILGLDEEKLSIPIAYDLLAGSGTMDLAEFIYRLLDHEVHHRGALVVYLKMFDKGV